ncbi:hypothetical protein J2Z31_005270 [Sinorhizobium kostiense]|uniref:Lipoprotein n=1 Tax=Sinorhizobium kostiense TaxID=76747 RepID=A0ABS4R7P0_9HYPH|nr:hypothetical protein [Sinorhizobium kostiense]
MLCVSLAACSKVLQLVHSNRSTGGIYKKGKVGD